jgi:hypothetical protein
MGNIYNEPGSTGKHIFVINNTKTDLQSNLGKCQIAIETDSLRLGFKDHLGAYHTILPSAIPHLPSAPAAIAGVTQPWILDDGAGNVDHDHIFLVFPVGGDNNKCITLSDIIFTP